MNDKKFGRRAPAVPMTPTSPHSAHLYVRVLQPHRQGIVRNLVVVACDTNRSTTKERLTNPRTRNMTHKEFDRHADANATSQRNPAGEVELTPEDLGVVAGGDGAPTYRCTDA
ncbi:MAG: hypothetical protein ACREBE_14925, partial [bacterium]